MRELRNCNEIVKMNTYDGQLRPMFELAVNDSNVSFIGGSTYLIIKGNFLFMDREGEMYIMQGLAIRMMTSTQTIYI